MADTEFCEGEKFFLKDPLGFFECLNLIPTGSFDARLNAILRIIILVYIIFLVMKTDNATKYFIMAIIVVAIIYYAIPNATYEGYKSNLTTRAMQRPIIVPSPADAIWRENRPHSHINSSRFNDLTEDVPCQCGGRFKFDQSKLAGNYCSIKPLQPELSVDYYDIQPNYNTQPLDPVPINHNIGITQTPEDNLLAPTGDNVYFNRNDPYLVRDSYNSNRNGEMPARSSQSDYMHPFEGEGNYLLGPESVRDPRGSDFGSTGGNSYFNPDAGNIRYYYDDVDAYRTPTYVNRSKIDHIDFVDPMGGVRPQYVRNPIQDMSLDEAKIHAENAWSKSQTEFRENMMASWMTKANERSWQLKQAPIRMYN